MGYTCKYCKYGLDRSPDGRRPPPGTLWCGKRGMAMGQNRNVSYFYSLVQAGSVRCQDCRWAKRFSVNGSTPALGKVWCERRRGEMNKLRSMECFE